MELLVGSVASLIGVAIYAWAYGQHHRVGAPRWASGQTFASGIALLVTGLAPIGAGFIATGLMYAGTQATYGWAALAALPVLCWLIAPRLMHRAPLSSTSATVHPLPTGPAVPPSPTPMRKAA